MTVASLLSLRPADICRIICPLRHDRLSSGIICKRTSAGLLIGRATSTFLCFDYSNFLIFSQHLHINMNDSVTSSQLPLLYHYIYRIRNLILKNRQSLRLRSCKIISHCKLIKLIHRNKLIAVSFLRLKNYRNII